MGPRPLPTRAAARRYVLERSVRGELTCRAERAGGVLRRLAHVKFHSPDGFEVGYSGSGPADLALAILVDLFAAPRRPSAYRMPRGRAADAWVLHQQLKVQFLSGLKVERGESAELDGEKLFAWAIEQRARVRARLAEDERDEARRVRS